MRSVKWWGKEDTTCDVCAQVARDPRMIFLSDLDPRWGEAFVVTCSTRCTARYVEDLGELRARVLAARWN